MNMIFSTARNCAIKTIAVFFVVAIIASAISGVIYYWSLVEASFLFLRHVLSIGESFWGGVFVSLTAMIFFTWLFFILLDFTGRSKQERESAARWFKWIVSLMVLCSVIWFVSLSGVWVAFEKMGDWNVFQGAAYFIVHIPVFVFIVSLFTLLSIVSGRG